MKLKQHKLLLLLLIIVLTFPLFASNPVSVPVSDPVYYYLERMETLGIVTNLLDGIRPFSRGRVAELLVAINDHRSELTHIDRRRLDDYLLDYRYEISRSQKYVRIHEEETWYTPFRSWTGFKKDFACFFMQNHPEEQNYVFIWESGGNNFYFNYGQDFTYEERSDSVHRSANWSTYRFRGLLGENFGYQAHVELHGLRGDQEYVLQHPVLKGSWSAKYEDDEPRFSDRSGGELIYRTEYVDFSFAQQEIEWGHGESGRLIFSTNPEQYPYISIAVQWGWGKFIALHGKLLSFPSDTVYNDYPKYPDKWVAAHRFEFSPWDWITVGLNENFIYGERYADWAYLIPFNLYRAVEQKLRDRDNKTISVDTELLPLNGFKIYGTIFLDEFDASQLFTDWYGNKHAYMAGLYLVDPAGLTNLSLRAEYTAIMPWVYTHKYPINRYTSDYRSLGHWAGPNSEVIYLHLRKDWHQRLSSGFKFRQSKHGANYPNENIGGDILLGHNDLLGNQAEPKTTSTFLEGILTTEKIFQFYVNYEVFNGLFLMGKYNWINTDTEGDMKKLNEFFVGFRLRY